MNAFTISVRSLSSLALFMSQWELGQLYKESVGVTTGYFTPEKIRSLELLADGRNEEMAAHLWMMSNVN